MAHEKDFKVDYNIKIDGQELAVALTPEGKVVVGKSQVVSQLGFDVEKAIEPIVNNRDISSAIDKIKKALTSRFNFTELPFLREPDYQDIGNLSYFEVSHTTRGLEETYDAVLAAAKRIMQEQKKAEERQPKDPRKNWQQAIQPDERERKDLEESAARTLAANGIDPHAKLVTLMTDFAIKTAQRGKTAGS